MKTEKAVVIFSGGQDSTTCLCWANNRYETTAITFDYGQSHKVEVLQSKEICRLLKIPQTIINLSFLHEIAESALLNGGDVSKTNEKGLPSSFVPNRNQLFITLAHSLAQKIGAKILVTGVCETDYSGYPDCRREYIEAISSATNLGSHSDIRIITPLMDLNKAETFLLAEKESCLDLVLEQSHTCYLGDRTTRNEWGYGCGDCPACKLRKKGWEDYMTQKENNHTTLIDKFL